MTGKMRVLITGSTGFIGRNLVPELLANNYDVIAITSNESQARTILQEKVRLYNWQTLDSIRSSYDKIDIVIHLAGANIGKKRWTKSYKKQLIDSRIETARQLADVLGRMKEKPDLWIQASAIGYYGHENVRVTNEKAEKGEGFLSDLTARWEEAPAAFCAGKIPLVRLRFGVVVHPSGAFLKPFLLLKNLKIISGVGTGKNYLSWVHIDDLVKLVMETLELRKNTVINVVSPHPLRMNEMYRILKKEYRALLTIRMPGFVLKWIMGREKTNELILADQYIKSEWPEDSGFLFTYKTFQEIF